MAKQKPTEKRSRGSGIGGYLLAMLLSAVLTVLLLVVLVFATGRFRSGGASSVSPIAVSQAEDTAVPSTPTPAASPTPAVTGVIASSSQSVNVRSGPGTETQVVGTVQPGTTVVILGQNPDGTWQNIQLEDGTVGWVSTSLMRLPQPTAAPTSAATEAVEATEEIVVVACEGDEAAEWWADSGEALYTQAQWVVLKAQANSLANINDVFVALDTERQTFEAADYAPCVQTLRQNLLTGVQDILSGLQTYFNGDQNAGRSRIQNAQTNLLQPTFETLTTDLGVQAFAGDCPVNAWIVGIEQPYANFMTTVSEFSPGALAPDQLRQTILDTQQLRQTIDTEFAPDCAAAAKRELLRMMDEGIKMLQGAFQGDQAAISTHQNGLVEARDTFRTEMSRLGYNVPIQP